MKKICYAVVFIIILFVYNNVSAETDTENLLAECHYVSEINSSTKLEIVIKVRKDYNLNILIGNFQSSTQYVKYVLDNKDISYEKFIGDNGIATCDNVDKIYQYITSFSDGATRQTTMNHYIQSKPLNPKPAGLSVGDYTYTYNESESKIYVEDNYDKEKLEEEGWLKICHYGSYYLKFDKEKYDTNLTRLVNNAGIDAGTLDVMKYLSETNYSCPTSLCSVGGSGRGYTWVNFYFKNEYDTKCIVSQDYVSEYRCGSLDYYMKEYNRLKETDNLESKIAVNEQLDKIQKFCDSVYKGLDYDDPTNCVKECLQIKNIIEKDIDIADITECGFSERLIVWLRNILKWIKYILPVVVIVLGILDFIKAVGADKDDELKKLKRDL